MKDSNNDRNEWLIPACIIVLWGLINLIFLIDFPFVHSDESWLSGLSRWMLQQRDIAVTEPFFDTYERNPHAFKLLFHLLQSAWILIFGYSINSVRALSLLFGALSLLQCYRLTRTLGFSETSGILTMLLLACDIQFIYAAHTGRQEILLVFLLLTVILRSLRTQEGTGIAAVITGLIAGASFGVHPNGALIAAAGLALMCFNGRAAVLRYIVAAAAALALFTGISLWENPGFFADYLAYGATLGVTEPPLTKLGRIIPFVQKLFYRVSGTYYTPPIHLELLLFAAALTLSIPLAFKKTPFIGRMLAALASMLIVFIGIGRYGQPSVVLFFPVLMIITVLTARRAATREAVLHTLLLVIIGILSYVSVIEVTSRIREQDSYTSYLEEIRTQLPEDAVVLANLNTEYAIAAGNLYDWRNLSEAAGGGIDPERYIRERDISYIIYPEEMDEIYRRRPVWNGIYGNPFLFHQDLRTFISEHCQPLYTGISSTYAMRIVELQQEGPWHYTIYRVSDETSR